MWKGTIGSINGGASRGAELYRRQPAELCKDDFLESVVHKTVAFSGDTAKNVNRAEVDEVIETLKKLAVTITSTLSVSIKPV